MSSPKPGSKSLISFSFDHPLPKANLWSSARLGCFLANAAEQMSISQPERPTAEADMRCLSKRHTQSEMIHLHTYQLHLAGRSLLEQLLNLRLGAALKFSSRLNHFQSSEHTRTR